jgi:LPXTG-motif cell wall-anchored protein
VASRLMSFAIRFALSAAMIVMTAVGVAGPAHAEPVAERPKVTVYVPNRVVTIDGGSKTVPIRVRNDGVTPATGLVLDFGTAASPIDARIGFQPPAGCTATGCVVGDLEPSTGRDYTFVVQPTAALPAAGVRFTVSLHDAGGEWRESSIAIVVPGGRGVDLEVARFSGFTLEAGESAVLPISVRNNGDEATDGGIAIELNGEEFLNFPNNYSNCVDGDAPAWPRIVCAFDLSLASGAVFTMSPSTPLAVAVDKTAPGAASYQVSMGVYALEAGSRAASLAAAKKAVKRPGTKLQLVPAVQSLAGEGNDLNYWDNGVTTVVKVARNPADSVAIGGTFEGKVGDTRTIKVGFRNDGPALVLRQNWPQWYQEAKVRIPSGLKLTKVDQGCFPNGGPYRFQWGQVSGHDYLCVSGYVGVGKQQLFSFTAKIQDGKNEDEGSITVDGGAQDPTTANNVAKIEVKLPAAGGTGGGLPVTGTPTTQVAVAGLLLMLTGALALVLTRRRRTGYRSDTLARVQR